MNTHRAHFLPDKNLLPSSFKSLIFSHSVKVKNQKEVKTKTDTWYLIPPALIIFLEVIIMACPSAFAMFSAIPKSRPKSIA